MNITMPAIKWDEKYSVGVPKMDEDDRVFFEFLNTLCDSMMGKMENKKQSEKTLISLLNFTMGHMLGEEVMLYKSDYPQIEKHIAEHDRYLSELRRMYVRYFAGDMDSRIMSAEMIGLLTELLQEHILRDDKMVGEFLNSNSEKQRVI